MIVLKTTLLIAFFIIPSCHSTCSVRSDGWVSCTGALPTSDELENAQRDRHTGLQPRLMLTECQFDSITNTTFIGSAVNKFVVLLISCFFPNAGYKSLTLSNGAFDGLPNLQIIDLAWNNIILPKGLFCSMAERLVYLSLNSNQLTDISQLGFGGSTVLPDSKNGTCAKFRLETLKLASNRLRTLGEDSFSRLVNLTDLLLDYNELTSVHANAFRNLLQLKTLGLSQNRLTVLPPPVFRTTTPSLANLDLSINQLGDEFYSSINGLMKLENLNASYNRLQRVDANVMSNIGAVQLLYLDHNNITKISDDAFRPEDRLMAPYLWSFANNNLSEITQKMLWGLSNVSILYLNNNRISNMEDDVFSEFNFLLYLRLNGNLLRKIPDLSASVSMGELDLSNNLIEAIREDQFANKQWVYRMFLQNNVIRSISSNHFRNMTSMMELNLSNNNISAIQASAFDKNAKLQTLRLDGNAIPTIDGLFTTGSSLPLLTKLNLSTNRLTHLSWANNVPLALTELHVSHNRIEGLGDHPETVPPQRKLLTLDASHNLIKFLDAGSLPRSLQSINLNHNEIVTVGDDTFSGLLELRFIDIQNNKMTLPCISWFQAGVDGKPRPQGRTSILLAGNPLICNCQTTWLSTINSLAKDTFPFIMDSKDITCSQSSADIFNLQLPEQVATTDALNANLFLCQVSNEQHNSTCFCDENRGKPICTMTCPVSCMCYHDEIGKMVIVDCSDGRMDFNLMSPNMSSFPSNTTILRLDRNNVKVVTTEKFGYFGSLEELALNLTGLQNIEDGAFQNLSKLQKLNLSSNFLVELSDRTFEGLRELQHLDLSKNQIQIVSLHAFDSLISLKVLLLNRNRLSASPAWNMKPMHNLQMIQLQDNPWSCDCNEMEAFRRWIKINADVVFGPNHINCVSNATETVSQNTILSYNHSNCLSTKQYVWFSPDQKAIVGAAGTVAVIIAAALGIVFFYRKEIRVLIYSRYGVRLFYGDEFDGDRDKIYDAFISYSNEDEGFVVNELLAGLENPKRHYSLCLHQRDFAVGSYIGDSIVEAVEQSRRTIIVLTQNFVDSEWCQFEFRAAHQQMLRDRRKRLIAVLVDKMPTNMESDINIYLKTNTYLNWRDKLFWQKLYFALPELN